MSGSLYLAPIDTVAPAPPKAQVFRALRDLDLIGEPLSEVEFAVGPNFSRHVVFAGCSPHLRLSPSWPGDLDFCHLALLGPYADLRLITGPHTRRPRCPNCGERAPSWQALQTVWRTSGECAQYGCTGCGRASEILAWRWQRQAVFGRLFVGVRGVFPSEGVPSDNLLEALRRTTGRPWDYGWAATVKP